MRRLGAALGVEAMALYHHFPSKGELLDGVMERLLAEAELPPPGSMPPLERLRTFVRSYRQIAIRHPHAFVLLAVRRFNTEAAFALYERILDALDEAGFDAVHSARLFRLIGYYASGAGLAEIASRVAGTRCHAGETGDLQRPATLSARSGGRPLPASEHPRRRFRVRSGPAVRRDPEAGGSGQARARSGIGASDASVGGRARIVLTLAIRGLVPRPGCGPRSQ